MSIWNYVKHFKRTENWGDPDKISGQLLLTLDAIRERIGWPIVIHCAYATDGHSPHSYHYRGMAADFHFDINYPFYFQTGTLLKILAELQFTRFVGLGVYPDWINPGFHIDVRGYYARWGRIGKDKYVSWEEIMTELKRRAGLLR